MIQLANILLRCTNVYIKLHLNHSYKTPITKWNSCATKVITNQLSVLVHSMLAVSCHVVLIEQQQWWQHELQNVYQTSGLSLNSSMLFSNVWSRGKVVMCICSFAFLWKTLFLLLQKIHSYMNRHQSMQELSACTIKRHKAHHLIDILIIILIEWQILS